MKKSIKRIITTLVVLFALIGASVTAYAAVNYGGAQDARQAKERISLVVSMLKRKDDKIKTLENEKKDFNKQLDDKNKVIADKDKTIADKEREKVQLENVIIQKETEISNLKGANEALKQELDNKVKGYKEQLEQAEKDIKEINNLLGDVVNENEGE